MNLAEAISNAVALQLASPGSVVLAAALVDEGALVPRRRALLAVVGEKPATILQQVAADARVHRWGYADARQRPAGAPSEHYVCHAYTGEAGRITRALRELLLTPVIQQIAMAPHAPLLVRLDVPPVITLRPAVTP